MRILFLNQAFYPDVVATGQVLTDLAVDLAAGGHRVTVISGANGYDDGRRRFAARERWKGIDIRRVPATRFGKGARWRRAVDFASFWIGCALRLAGVGRHDAIVALTSPPLISVLGAVVAALTRSRLVLWIMDLNPDEAIAAGWLDAGALPARVLQAMMTWSLRRADHVIALDRFMKERIVARGIDPEKVAVIPPWSHDGDVRYDAAGAARFREEHGLAGRFVVMYAGNHSPCHPLDALLDAARELRDDPHVTFVFAGGGSGVEQVRHFKEQHGLTNIVQLPYQPFATLSALLSAADLHAVVLGEPFVGIVHPCKVYNILRVGSPLLYIGPERSHVADLAARLTEHPVYVVRPTDPSGAAAAIREASRAGRATARHAVDAGCGRADLIPQVVRVLTAPEAPRAVPSTVRLS